MRPQPQQPHSLHLARVPHGPLSTTATPTRTAQAEISCAASAQLVPPIPSKAHQHNRVAAVRQVRSRGYIHVGESNRFGREGKKVAGDLEAEQTYNFLDLLFGYFLLDIITTYISPSRSCLKPSRTQNLSNSLSLRGKCRTGAFWRTSAEGSSGPRHIRIDIGVNRRPPSNFCTFFLL
jgi:hypothetical protein